MKKLFLVLVSAAALSTTTLAQKGTTQIGVGAEVGLPMGDFGDACKTGFGGSVKGLFGIGQAGQITFSTGYSTFGAKDLPDGYKMNFSIIPLLAGYRHNFSGLYVEPQLGYGIYGVKMEAEGMSASDSEGIFTWAMGAGYVFNNFDLGLRYQSGSKDGETISFMGIRVGYNFSLGGSSSK